MNFRKGYLLALPAALVVIFFQNCAENVQFSKDLSSSSMSAMDSISQQTLFYTNTNYVKIKVNIDSVWFTQCRASIYQDMDAKGVAWQPCGKSQELLVYLNEEYASGGLKDGPKTIYVEASDETAGKKDNAPKISARVTAFLDTLVPDIDGLDILKKGLAGATFKKDQSVTLNWTAEDKIAATNESSGIDPVKGIRWAITKNGSCEDASITNVSDWTNGDVRKTDLKWPAADPLETFYVCIYAQDRAGNRGYFLSQPLTSLWTVIAGDNSVGDGASVTAPQVRFKSPFFLSQDPNSLQIHFQDRHLNVYRTIKNARKDTARTIESSQLPKFASKVVFDSKGYGYFKGVDDFVVQLGLDRQTVKKIVKLSGNVEPTIRKYKGVESLVMGNNSKIYEIPLSAVAGIAAAGLDVATFESKYKIAGTGVIPFGKSAISDTLSKNDPADDDTKAIGWMEAVTADEDGDIYVSTNTDGNGGGKGHQATRVLQQNADGTFKQTVLFRSSWELDSAYAKRYVGTQKQEFLIIACTGGLYSLNLTKWKATKVATGIETKIAAGYFTAALPEYYADKKDFELYAGISNTSQILHYDGQFKLLEAFGRAIYETDKEGKEQDALKMVLGHPGGLYTSPNTSDVYIHDNQNMVVFRLNEEGTTKKVAGTQKYDSAFLIGYAQRLAGDFSGGKKMLYFQNRVADLQAGTEKELYSPTAIQGGNWYNSSLAFVPGANGKAALYNVRHKNVYTTEPWYVTFTGFVHKVDLTGNTQVDAHSNYLGDLMQGALNSAEPSMVMDNSAVNLNYKANYVTSKAVVDSQKFMFISGGQLIINKLGESQSYLLKAPQVRAAFTVLEAGTLRYIFYPAGTRVAYITVDLAKITPTAKESDFVSPAKTLCLPGTNLKGVWDLAIAKSGNLVIADSDNSRVLLYRIRDSAGKLTLMEQGAAGCTK